MTAVEIAERESLYRRIIEMPKEDFSLVRRYVEELEERRPNEETIAAMQETDRIARDPNAKRYSSAKELFAELRAECTR